MSAFNEHQFEKRLQLLKDSQESIQSLSAWCLQHRQHHKKIVGCWLRVLKKVKIEHRLTLFYLANDVIQYSKRKNYEFVESWGTALQRATTMVREERVKHRILRIFKIWDERGIYDEAFIADLSGLLSTNTKKSNSETIPDTSDFQPPSLINKIRSCKKLEDDTDLKLKRLNESHLSFSDADALRSHLKDRRQGDDLVAEVDEGVNKMQGYVKALELEIKERSALIELLEHADSFYETQKGEAKVVANAYRNFGSRVKNLKRRLDELIPTLKDVSPIPSPDVNAPSPSPDSDIELPEEGNNMASMGDSFYNPYAVKANPIKTVLQDDSAHQQSMDNCFSSFMGNSSLAFDIQGYTPYSMVRGMRDGVKSLFNETTPDTPASPPPINMEDSDGVPLLTSDPDPEPEPVSEGKPIEVISSRTKSEDSFNITEFLKSLIPSGSSPSIPGLNMDTPTDDPVSKSMYNSATDITTASQYDYPEEPAQTPLQPPPLPPNLFPLEDTSYKYDQAIEREEDAWNTKLPPKFPTWGDTASGWEREETEKTSEWSPVLPPNKVLPVPPVPAVSLDTPESPPMYEKEGFSDPVEYDDSIVEPPLMLSSGDVDHRTLVHLPQINHTKDSDCRIPPPVKHMQDTDHRVILPVTPSNHLKKDMDHRPMLTRKKDVDHRNLISLTGSPVHEHSALLPPPTPPSLNWSRSDQDYRTPLPMKKEVLHKGDQDYRLHPPHVGRRHFDETQDNVESVDMEMSDEEMAEPLDMPIDNMRDNKKHMMDKNRDYDIGNKPVISFNINSNTKVLVNSPLNEVKDDLLQPRNRVYGCQKIPTISGIGGTMHSPRGMGPPRPRMPMLTPPPGVKRLPPPSLPRGFRPSLMMTPPPLPPFPPQIIQQQERFNVTIEIKPQEEIESQRKNEEHVAPQEFIVEEEVVTDSQLISPPPSSPETITGEKEKPQVNEKKDSNSISIPLNNTLENKIEKDVKNAEPSETGESTVSEEEKKETKGEGGGEKGVTVEKAEHVAPVSMPQVIPKPEFEKQNKPTNMVFSEHWMNNELAELEQIENMSREQEQHGNIGRGQEQHGNIGRGQELFENKGRGQELFENRGRGQGGRGRPFKNFPRGGFIPRTRPMWNGPRRGGLRPPPPPPPPPPPLPPGRFPFRPPLERPFGRGLRGGFRPPFRGNRGHRGW